MNCLLEKLSGVLYINVCYSPFLILMGESSIIQYRRTLKNFLLNLWILREEKTFRQRLSCIMLMEAFACIK